jgi:hypothetical protein
MGNTAGNGQWHPLTLWLDQALVPRPPEKKPIRIRLDEDVLDHFDAPVSMADAHERDLGAREGPRVKPQPRLDGRPGYSTQIDALADRL